MARPLRLLAGALGAMGAAASVLVSPRAHAADRFLSGLVAHPRSSRTDRVAGIVTDLGSVFAVAGAAGTLAALGRRDTALDVLGAGATGWLAAQALKPLAARPRPYQADGVFRLVAEPAGASWPSGHPAVAAAVATAVAAGLGPNGRRVAAAAAGTVGVTRVYVGVHYVGDVVAGLALGVVSGTVWGWTGPLWRRLRSRIPR